MWKMKRTLLIILAAILVVVPVFALLLALPSPVSAGGIVANQGFEDPLGSANWTAVNAQRTDDAPVHTGSWVGQITVDNGSLTQLVNVTGLARYQCWGYVYATANATGKIELTFLDADEDPVGAGAVLTASNTTGYELRSKNLRAPYDAEKLRIRLVGVGLGTYDDVRFDEIGVSLPAGGCFIATAAYGTPLAEEIQVLRQFRDEYLLTNTVGRLFVSLYYEGSPPLAHLISKHEGLKAITRVVLEPIVWFCYRITTPPSR